MKVSLNTLRFINKRNDCGNSLEHYQAKELLQKIGTQLGAIEGVEDLGKKYEGVIIAKVVTCKKHPDADKLHICSIDDGDSTPAVKRDANGHIQVVCGAPNVREGLLTAWIPPGVTVPVTFGKDPFVLESREIRGEMSNGMLASAHELALGDDHGSILEVDKEIIPGAAFSEAYELKDDIVIDIENKMFTHRPDCFGFIGLARELAGIQHKAYKSPPWYEANADFPAVETDELKLIVHNELPKLVPRFGAITMRDVRVGPSPIWLQLELAKVGVRSVNNIVDYTNFFMFETGQPLHAYDYDKVLAQDPRAKHATIIVRYPKKGEKITLLGGKVIVPRRKAVLIASATKPIGLGGVMGGANTEVDANTKKIILECANFDMYSIRKTSMEHGLFTDAVTRFTKGQSPHQTRLVLAKIVDEIRRFASGKVASKALDIHGKLAGLSPVTITANFINSRLGIKLSLKEIKTLLENVEFKILSVPAGKTRLHVVPPFWRTDIEIPEDIVEEIGRLYGYDHLSLTLPKRSLTPAKRDTLLTCKQAVRSVLSRAGANEVLTYTFVHGDLMKKAGQDPKHAFQLSNALSPDLQYYRFSLIPSLLALVHSNIKADYNEFALFEINPTHSKDLREKDNDLPKEDQRLGLVFAASDKLAETRYAGAAYYQARVYAETLLHSFGIHAEFEPAEGYEPTMEISKQTIAPFELSRSTLVKTGDGQFIGELGEFKASVRRSFKLPAFVAGFEFDISQLQKLRNITPGYQKIARFPKVEQDISLKVSSSVPFAKLETLLREELRKAAPINTVYEFEVIDIYQKAAAKHVTFRLSIASYERTMVASEVNRLLDIIAQLAKSQLDVERL